MSTQYTIVRHNDQIIMALNLGAAALIKDALVIVNPDESEPGNEGNQQLADDMASGLEALLNE